MIDAYVATPVEVLWLSWTGMKTSNMLNSGTTFLVMLLKNSTILPIGLQPAASSYILCI